MAEDKNLLLEERKEGMSKYSRISDEDLSPNDNRNSNDKKCGFNRRALVLFFGVTAVAVAVLVSAVIFTVYSGGGLSRQRRGNRGVFTFEDIFNNKYQPNDVFYNWIKHSESQQAKNQYLTRKKDDIVLVTLDSAGKSHEKILLQSSVLEEIGPIRSYWISPDQQFLLIAANDISEYRYSYYADYYIYQIDSSPPALIRVIPPSDDEQIYYAAWNKRGHSMIYVFKNNIYYLSDDKLLKGNALQLTDSGEKHKIFNGVPDWVYQEEVLNNRYASWFSLDGKFLCYIEFNDTFVRLFEYPWYGDKNNSYPKLHRIAYPKSGTANPTVTVKLVDLSSRKTFVLVPTMSGEHYVTTVAWSPNNDLLVTWVNRNQDKSRVTRCNTNGVCAELKKATLSLKGTGWIDSEYHAPVFDSSGKAYFILRPFPQASGSFIHLASVNITTGEHFPLTSGNWEVTKILAFDDDSKIYFESTEVSPMQRHIYSLDLRNDKKTCITCGLDSHKIDKECNYFRASFSAKAAWFTLHCQGPGVPRTTLHSTRTNPTVTVQVLADNTELRKNLQQISLPKVEYFTVKSDGFEIQAKAVLPPTFDSSKAGKYAVLFDVYGGPASQKVVETFGLSWGNGYLVSNFDIILVTCDARGSGFRGESFKHAVYKQLGKYEAKDTIAVARYMAKKSYVDKKKIAIWGWSYGGFLTSYVLGHQATRVFSLGIAVAPVTDWRYYDTIYTERYMLTPQKNSAGYQGSTILSLVRNFNNTKYLLVHGTGDDNVHFQNSAELVKELTRVGVKYRVQYYTDQNHGLSGGGTYRHLWHLLTDFLVDGLMLVGSS